MGKIAIKGNWALKFATFFTDDSQSPHVMDLLIPFFKLVLIHFIYCTYT